MTHARLRAIERELEQLRYESIRLNNQPLPSDALREWTQDRLSAIAERERLLEVEHEALRNNQSKEAA